MRSMTRYDRGDDTIRRLTLMWKSLELFLLCTFPVLLFWFIFYCSRRNAQQNRKFTWKRSLTFCGSFRVCIATRMRIIPSIREAFISHWKSLCRVQRKRWLTETMAQSKWYGHSIHQTFWQTTSFLIGNNLNQRAAVDFPFCRAIGSPVSILNPWMYMR